MSNAINGGSSFSVPALRVGCVLSGTKVVWCNMQEVRYYSGELFCMGPGCREVRNIPNGELLYKERVVEYSSDELRAILSREIELYGGELSAIDGPMRVNSAGCCAGAMLQSFFSELPTEGPISEADKRLLVQLVLRLSDRCVMRCLLGTIDKRASDFERRIFDHIFDDCSLEELAELSHCSLTSFKRLFREHFNATPHKWITEQRMEHARRQLACTSKSVAEIATECMYPNNSHFIKRFRLLYNITPMAYRHSLRARRYGCDDDFAKE